MYKNRIRFIQLFQDESTFFDVYYVQENGKSIFMDEFSNLPTNKQEQTIELMRRMATVKNYHSPKIKYNLKKYAYGEIRIFPDRFFFFRKCGNNFIFFEHLLKKRDSLSDKEYKRINIKKKKYEEAFEKFLQRR